MNQTREIVRHSKKVKFFSPHKNYRINVIPSRYFYNGMQQKQYVAGLSAEFKPNGEYATDDLDVIKFLLTHKAYGLRYTTDLSDKEVAEILGEEVAVAESEKVAQAKAEKEEAVSTTRKSCPHCSFTAVNEAGLKAHIRSKHQD